MPSKQIWLHLFTLLFSLSFQVTAQNNFDPILIPTGGRSNLEYRQEKAAIFMSLVDEYLEKGSDSEETKILGSRFMQKVIAQQCLLSSHSSQQKLNQLASFIMADNPQDPLLKGFLKLTIVKNSTTKRLDESLIAYPQTTAKYSLLAQIFIEYQHLRFHRKASTKMQNLLALYMAKRSPSPSLLRFKWDLCNSIIRETPLSNKKFYSYALGKHRPQSPWLADMMAATLNYYSAQVNKEQSAKHLNLAVRHYNAAHALQPKFPEAASRLILIGKKYPGLGVDKKVWFKKSLAIEFDYIPSYENYIKSSPGGPYGSDEELIQLSRACIASGRYDTQVPFQARTIAQALNWSKVNKYKLFPELDKMFRFYKKYEEDHEIFTQHDRSLLQSKHLSYALRTDSYSSIMGMEELYDQQNYTWSGIEPFHEDAGIIYSQAHAYSSNIADEIKKISSLIEGVSSQIYKCDRKAPVNFLKTQLQVLDSLQAKCDKYKARDYIHYLKERINNLDTLYDSLIKTGWIPIEFDPTLSSWVLQKGHYDIENKQSIILSSNASDQLFFRYTRKFPRNFEFEYEVEHLDNFKADWSILFFKMESPYMRSHSSSSSIAAWTSPLKNFMGIYKFRGRKFSSWRVEDTKKNYKVNVKSWRRTCEVSFNDNEYLDSSYAADRKIFTLNFKTHNGSNFPGKFRIKNLRIRKLESPEPQIQTQEKALAHYRERLKSEETLAIHRRIALLANDLKDFKLALTHYKKAADLQSWWVNDWDCANAAMKAKDYPSSAAYYNKALNKIPPHGWYTKEFADGYIKSLNTSSRGALDTSESIKIIESKLASQQEQDLLFFVYHVLLGYMHLNNNNQAAAISSYKNAQIYTEHKQKKMLTSLQKKLKIL